MEEHILKQDILSGYPHSHYYNNIHSIIENIKEVIFLDNENGWINTDGNKVDIGTWNKETRIATLDNKIDQRGKLFLIEVSNVTIDGAGVIIGDNDIAISIIGQHAVNLKNFIIENSKIAIYIEFSQEISIQYMSFKENEESIVSNRSSEIRIKNNEIASSKSSSVGIFILDSGKVIIQNNSITININTIIEEFMKASYAGIITENSTTIYIMNNAVEIINSNFEISNLDSYSFNAYCINSFSTYDTLIKYNNLYIKNNSLDFKNCNLVQVEISSICLDCNNIEVNIEENNIGIENNKLEVNCNDGEMGVYGILCSSENNSNSVKNNYIYVSSNAYGLNSNENSIKDISFIGILLDFNNNHNEIGENQIELKENRASFESGFNKAVNLVCGLYLNSDNSTNNIIDNDFTVRENNIDKNSSIKTSFSLIYFYYNNICNTIKGNNLNESQGNGVILISKNDSTEILENNIMNNLMNGLLVSTAKDNGESNGVVIKENSIINNGNYGLYIIEGSHYNIVRYNNFISNGNKNIYDNNSLKFANYYEKNYYNDWNGQSSYKISGSDFEDSYSVSTPYTKK